MAKRWTLILLLTGMAVSAAPGAEEFSDPAIARAIERGKAFLWSQQQPDGGWKPYGDPGEKDHAYNYHPTGPGALAMYALLACDADPQEPRMRRALQWLAKFNAQRTYSLGARCCAWLLANQKTNKQYLPNLKAEARLLMMGGLRDGGYNYYAKRNHMGNPGGISRIDNSCSQFGLLGVWSASLGDVQVPKKYWKQVLGHWLKGQTFDGGWDYLNNPNGQCTPTMTVSGIASLFVCVDNLMAERYVDCRGGEMIRPLEKALEWLDKHYDDAVSGKDNEYYFLYGVERVGLASGYKYFGKSDWYHIGTRKLLSQQKSDGGWGSVWDSAFALLFLARGRHPVLMNKLEYPGAWNNRPRALASLTQWISRNLEQEVNWQIINLESPVSEWHDASILLITGHQNIDLDDEQIKKLRTFVLQGGTIFSVREGGGSFGKSIRKLYEKLFPEYKLLPAGPDHPLYRAHYKLPGRPKFFVMSNGIRPLVIHTDDDLAVSWQTQSHGTQRRNYEAAVNIVRHVVGDIEDLRPRGVSHWPVEDDLSGTSWVVKLARLRHKGQWDPEPLAYERLGVLLANRLWTRLDVETLDAKDVAKTEAKVASLTGLGALELSPEETAALKAWVEGGGTLVIDAAAGDRAFARSAQKWIEEAFGKFQLKLLPQHDPLYRQEDKEIREVQYRRATFKRLGKANTPRLYAISKTGKNEYDEEVRRPAVLFSAEDITCGLVGYPSGFVDGYRPKSAYEIMRNILFLAGDIQTED
ncbi:MAG: DUF4159 domain-containing protein [Phycisphaerae bacterium]|nr:DUF4159 domain-containing protein [Phycisphaerae bacterium]